MWISATSISWVPRCLSPHSARPNLEKFVRANGVRPVGATLACHVLLWRSPTQRIHRIGPHVATLHPNKRCLLVEGQYRESFTKQSVEPRGIEPLSPERQPRVPHLEVAPCTPQVYCNINLGQQKSPNVSSDLRDSITPVVDTTVSIPKQTFLSIQTPNRIPAVVLYM